MSFRSLQDDEAAFLAQLLHWCTHPALQIFFYHWKSPAPARSRPLPALPPLRWVDVSHSALNYADTLQLLKGSTETLRYLNFNVHPGFTVSQASHLLGIVGATLEELVIEAWDGLDGSNAAQPHPLFVQSNLSSLLDGLKNLQTLVLSSETAWPLSALEAVVKAPGFSRHLLTTLELSFVKPNKDPRWETLLRKELPALKRLRIETQEESLSQDLCRYIERLAKSKGQARRDLKVESFKINEHVSVPLHVLRSK